MQVCCAAFHVENVSLVKVEQQPTQPPTIDITPLFSTRDPSFKRSFCSSCHTILVPGVNCRIRVRGGRNTPNRLVTTCLHCAQTSSLLAPPHRSSTPAGPATEEAPLSAASPDATVKPTHGLDGPVRAAKRAKWARPVPFWQQDRHRLVPISGQPSSSQLRGDEKGKARAMDSDNAQKIDESGVKARVSSKQHSSHSHSKGQSATGRHKHIPDKKQIEEMDEEEMMNAA